MMYIGVDLHKTKFTAYFSKNGRWREYGTNETGYKSFLLDIRQIGEYRSTCVGVESTGNTRYFKNVLEQEGVTVKVINTCKFKVINESVNKTDKRDAATIAEFLEKDMLPEAKICSQYCENVRLLLKARRDTVRHMVRLKNQIHSLLVSHGFEDKKASLQSKRGRHKIVSALEKTSIGLIVHLLCSMLDELSKKVKQIEAEIEKMVAGDRVIELLQTIPGCGKVTAWTIRAYTDDIARFKESKHYAAYAGLVPWVRNSNETIHHGRITKRGPEELRTAFVQLVMGMHRLTKTKDYRLMVQYRTMKKHKGSGKAIIATARKFSKIVWHMLRYNEPFNPDFMVDAKLTTVIENMRKASVKSI